MCLDGEHCLVVQAHCLSMDQQQFCHCVKLKTLNSWWQRRIVSWFWQKLLEKCTEWTTPLTPRWVHPSYWSACFVFLWCVASVMYTISTLLRLALQKLIIYTFVIVGKLTNIAMMMGYVWAALTNSLYRCWLWEAWNIGWKAFYYRTSAVRK